MRPLKRELWETLAVCAAITLLAGCASGIPLKESQPAVRERYAAYAGEPIRQFNWLGDYYSWEPVAKDELVVFTTPSEAYLLKVWPSCPDLIFLTGPIGLTSTSHTVSAGLDSVRTERMSCPIEEIRKVDYQRMQADLRREAQNKGSPGSGASPQR